MNDVTTKTNIIDIKSIIDENDGHHTNFQKLKSSGKHVRDNHTVGYYNIQRERELRLNGRLRGGGGKNVIKTIVKSKSIEKTVHTDLSVYEKAFMTAMEVHKVTRINFKEIVKYMTMGQLELLRDFILHQSRTMTRRQWQSPNICQSSSR